MRPFFWLLVVLALIIFCLTVYSLARQLSQIKTPDISLNGGFKEIETLNATPGLKELEALYVSKIKGYKEKAERHYTNWLWISFLVTALTAASTLVSSIKAASDGTTVGKNTMILIAIFTFLATLGNWGAGQLNVAKTEAQKNMTTTADHRSRFLADFQKANDDTERAEIV